MQIRLRPAIAAALTLLLALPAAAEVIRGIGGPMDFGSSYGINEGSTLKREWVIVTDKRLPVKLSNFVAIVFPSSSPTYLIKYTFETETDIKALEVRFIPFDIWGESGTPLSSTEIRDYSAGEHSHLGEWRIFSESEAVHHYAMLGYVAQVKLSTGKILRANIKDVIREAQRFSEDFSSGDLSADE